MYKKLNLDHLRNDYIICSCEGASEEAIMNILLDNNQLIFSRNSLVDNEVIRCRKASEIENKYLKRAYGKDVCILRISDSKNEKFTLGKLYRDTIKLYTVLTRPEIEVLLLIGEGEDDKYFRSYKSTQKPSEYCKQLFSKSKHSIKSKTFINSYFKDPNFLIKTIKTYHEKYRNDDPLTLYQLLQDK